MDAADGSAQSVGSAASFGRHLRALRVRAGLTQEALAEKARVSVATIAALEVGDRKRPYPHTVAAVAEALGLPAADRKALFEGAQAGALARSGRTRRSGWDDERRTDADRGLSLPPIRHNLPAHWASFVGRLEELAEVRRLLVSNRLVTLTGPGGCGKTRLATQVASEVLGDYMDGVWLVELGELVDAELVPQAMATALSMREMPGLALADMLAETLRTWHTLLVLDNCEHLLPASAALVHMLLRACPRVSILTTSREPLGLTGEATWPVPSMTLPFLQRLGVGPAAVAACQRSEAVQLLVDRAVAVQPSFKLTDQNAAAIAQVCVRLDGIPLALELAAARLKVLTADQLAARLNDRFRLLGGTNSAVAPRQRTLTATIDWSYDMLTAPERKLFNGLSTFAGSFTLEAAEAVCTPEQADGENVLDLLVRLVDRSLVIADQHEDGGARVRYRLLETLREYAAQRLARTDASDTIRGRHAVYYQELAEGVEPQLYGPRVVQQLDALELEHPNLRAALDWICAHDEGAQVLRLAGALASFWWMRGHAREGSAWLDQALRLATRAQVQPVVRAKALHGAAVLSNALGDHALVMARHQESAALFKAAGDVLGASRAINSLGGAAYDKGDLAGAAMLWEESLALARESGELGEIARSLGHVGLAAYHLGDTVAAASHLEEALAIARKAGRQDVEAIHLGDLANVALRLGDIARAAALQRTALDIEVVLGDQRQIAICLEHLAAIAAVQSHGAPAARLMGAAQVVREAICSPQPVPERLDSEMMVAQARVTLGETRWAEAMAAGRALSLEAAIEEALADR